MRTISVIKGQHRYIFRYQQGRECDVLEVVAELAADSTTTFDWMDAAGMSFEIASDQAASCLKAIAPSRRSA